MNHVSASLSPLLPSLCPQECWDWQAGKDLKISWTDRLFILSLQVMCFFVLEFTSPCLSPGQPLQFPFKHCLQETTPGQLYLKAGLRMLTGPWVHLRPVGAENCLAHHSVPSTYIGSDDSRYSKTINCMHKWESLSSLNIWEGADVVIRAEVKRRQWMWQTDCAFSMWFQRTILLCKWRGNAEAMFISKCLALGSVFHLNLSVSINSVMQREHTPALQSSVYLLICVNSQKHHSKMISGVLVEERRPLLCNFPKESASNLIPHY